MIRPKRVLLIDDDKEDCEIFRDALNTFGYPVELLYEEDSQSALQKLSGALFGSLDFIILDWYLPKISGKDCLRAIKQSTHYADVPVIIYTGATSITYTEEALQLGAAYFLPKPSGLEEFQKKLEEMMTRDWSRH